MFVWGGPLSVLQVKSKWGRGRLGKACILLEFVAGWKLTGVNSYSGTFGEKNVLLFA